MTPNDVYDLVDARTGHMMAVLRALIWVAVGVIFTIVAQIVAKVIIWNKVIRLLNETREVLEKVKLLVRIAEGHGKLNDQNTTRAESLLSQTQEVVRQVVPPAAEKILTEVRQVPDKVVEKLHGDSGTNLRPVP